MSVLQSIRLHQIDREKILLVQRNNLIPSSKFSVKNELQHRSRHSQWVCDSLALMVSVWATRKATHKIWLQCEVEQPSRPGVPGYSSAGKEELKAPSRVHRPLLQHQPCCQAPRAETPVSPSPPCSFPQGAGAWDQLATLVLPQRDHLQGPTVVPPTTLPTSCTGALNGSVSALEGMAFFLTGNLLQ